MINRNRNINTAWESNPRPDNWREGIKALQEIHRHFNQYSGIMTQYEREVISQEIFETQGRWESVIQDGMTAELKAGIAAIESARGKIARARQNESNRWDPARLSAEMDVFERRAQKVLDIPAQFSDPSSKSDALQTMYAEAMASGDPYKQRAACEVAIGLTGKPGHDDNRLEEKMRVNRIVKQAERDLPQVRTTEEVQKAIESELQTQANLESLLGEVRRLDDITKPGGWDKQVALPYDDFHKTAARIYLTPQGIIIQEEGQ